MAAGKRKGEWKEAAPTARKKSKKEPGLTKAPKKPENVTSQADNANNLPTERQQPLFRQPVSHNWRRKVWHIRTNKDGTTERVEGRLGQPFGNIAHPYDKTTVRIALQSSS
jgi:hypothetical protein